MPVSMMWALNVTRSTMAATSLGSARTVRFAEGEVGAGGDAGSFFAFGDDLKEEFGATAVDLDVAELVEQQQVQAAVAAHDAGQDAVAGGFDEFVAQLGGG